VFEARELHQSRNEKYKIWAELIELLGRVRDSGQLRGERKLAQVVEVGEIFKREKVRASRAQCRSAPANWWHGPTKILRRKVYEARRRREYTTAPGHEFWPQLTEETFAFIFSFRRALQYRHSTSSPPQRLPHSSTMKRKVGALEKLESDHAALRFKLKRDPQSYRDDFEQQYQQYKTLLDLFLADPSSTDGGLVALKE